MHDHEYDLFSFSPKCQMKPDKTVRACVRARVRACVWLEVTPPGVTSIEYLVNLPTKRRTNRQRQYSRDETWRDANTYE